MEAGGLVKVRLASVDVGVLDAGGGSDGAGLGELVDFFWKNPRMDFWVLADCEADAGCFFCEGRGVDISLPSMPRTMVETPRERELRDVQLIDDERSRS
jgi:hypothetical protein